MSDAPIQTILQQKDARPVSGEHLEVLGKQAASMYVEGKTASLHEAIVETVRGERLAPEQVKRVVEFTNGDAYLQEFRKEGSHKVVHFDRGPADPAQVLQDLNDGGGGSRYDRGSDYARNPSDVHKEASWQRPADFYESQEKTAAVAGDEAVEGLPKLPKMPSLPKHAHHEDALWASFTEGQTPPIAFTEPMQPLVEARSKLAAAAEQTASEIDALELDYTAAGEQLYGVVKQAALEGTSMADVVQAWSSISEDPLYVKIAFRMMTPLFKQDGVFPSLDAIGESLMKQASAGEANSDHPLVTSYAEFIEALNKLANMRVLNQEFVTGVEQTELLMKQAAGGILGGAKQAINAASQGIDQASPAIAHFLVGAKDAPNVAPTLAKGLKATGAVGAALGANAALQSVTDRPVVRSGLNAAQSLVPGTAAYNDRRYRTMTGQ